MERTNNKTSVADLRQHSSLSLNQHPPTRSRAILSLSPSLFRLPSSRPRLDLTLSRSRTLHCSAGTGHRATPFLHPIIDSWRVVWMRQTAKPFRSPRPGHQGRGSFVRAEAGEAGAKATQKGGRSRRCCFRLLLRRLGSPGLQARWRSRQSTRASKEIGAVAYGVHLHTP